MNGDEAYNTRYEDFRHFNLALVEGKEAFKQGLNKDSNPYRNEFGNIYFMGWNSGWESEETNESSSGKC